MSRSCVCRSAGGAAVWAATSKQRGKTKRNGLHRLGLGDLDLALAYGGRDRRCQRAAHRSVEAEALPVLPVTGPLISDHPLTLVCGSVGHTALMAVPGLAASVLWWSVGLQNWCLEPICRDQAVADVFGVVHRMAWTQAGCCLASRLLDRLELLEARVRAPSERGGPGTYSQAPLRWLQGAQSSYRFAGLSAPPRECGMTWSYWIWKFDWHSTHRPLSRVKTSRCTSRGIGWRCRGAGATRPCSTFRSTWSASAGRAAGPWRATAP